MNIHPDMTIGEMVAHHYRTAEVFNRHSIDFCCGGKKTLGKACLDHNIAWETMEQELQRALREPELSSGNMDQWEPDFLAEYIVQVHHKYLRENLPLLREYAAKIAGKHGERHPELKILNKQVELLQNDLLEHMDKEEEALFPHIRALCAAQRRPGQTSVVLPVPVQESIELMEHEHDYAGSLLENLRHITGDFTAPANACTTWRVTYAKLKALDEDLRWHVHLENNILFPKTMLLEQMLGNQN